MTNDEVLELAGTHGIKRRHNDPKELWCWEHQLLSFAVALEEKHQAQIAMLVDFIKRAQVSSGVCCCGDSMENHAEPYVCGHVAVDIWDNAVLGIVKDAQQDTDAFIAEVRAKAESDGVKKAMELLLKHGEDHDWRIMAKNMGNCWAELRNSAAQPEGKEVK